MVGENMNYKTVRAGRIVPVPLLFIAFIGALGAGAVSAAARKPATAEEAAAKERLAAILKSFDATQASTRTLTAAFTERKEIALLGELVVAKGGCDYTVADDV